MCACHWETHVTAFGNWRALSRNYACKTFLLLWHPHVHSWFFLQLELDFFFKRKKKHEIIFTLQTPCKMFKLAELNYYYFFFLSVWLMTFTHSMPRDDIPPPSSHFLSRLTDRQCARAVHTGFRIRVDAKDGRAPWTAAGSSRRLRVVAWGGSIPTCVRRGSHGGAQAAGRGLLRSQLVSHRGRQQKRSHQLQVRGSKFTIICHFWQPDCAAVWQSGVTYRSLRSLLWSI